ncbi:hypothetical protein TIFTF001_000555 [Ficus carica]|uniref:Malectin-like domain-containing protein n=1 Tax=Ficus carica TaxID=3494 RepID=A0AA88CPE3_FICCA|nr:hypothetical protein TIFTF001_000555 [Ficus carica]
MDDQIASEPIEPPYGDVIQMYLTNTTASSKTTFGLVATKDSTLPPLISAMEVFYVAGPLTEGTNSRDRKKSLVFYRSGPVTYLCLPLSYMCDWVNCSSDDIPRITALYLNGYSLKSTIPDFSSLDALKTIDFHNNSLTRSIPDFLGNLPNLEELNLADHKLSGPVPTLLSKNDNIKLDISGNPNLCASSKLCSTQKSKNKSNSESSGSIKLKSHRLPAILGVLILSSFFVVF